LLLGQSMAGEA